MTTGSAMLIQQLKLALAPPGWRLLAGSWRGNLSPLAPGPVTEPVIFACWHRDILPAIAYCRPSRPWLLISKSLDGDILVSTLARDGFGFVRGSTGHDGYEGFVGLLRALREGHHLGLAVDGPRGPAGVVREGVLQLAWRAGAPIVPLRVACRRAMVLGTWDRTIVPRPLSRVTVVAGAPLRVTEGDLPDARTRLAVALQTVGEEANRGRA